MNKDNWARIVIVVLTTIVMIFISEWQVYLDVKSNIFFLFLLIFFLSITIGLGVPKLFNFKKKEKFENNPFDEDDKNKYK